MMTQLKTLTLLAVCSAMDLLLHSKDKTSTLEVKLLLRDMGFDASQPDVSRFMNEVFDEPANANKYKRELVGDPGKKYHEYSLVGAIDDTSAAATDHGNSSSVTNTPNVVVNGTPTPSADGKPMPKFVVDQDTFQSTVDTYKHKNDWIVNKAEMEDGDNYAIFDEKMTRDQVRSRFSSINKIKINGVRARRIISIK